jgi:serine/threonine-protein kinase
MVYELISGKLPFTATTPSDLLNKHLRMKPTAINVLNKNVHADFANLLHRMLAKEAKERPDSLKEFIRDLKAGRVFQIKPRKPIAKAEVKEEE